MERQLRPRQEIAAGCVEGQVGVAWREREALVLPRREARATHGLVKEEVARCASSFAA